MQKIQIKAFDTLRNQYGWFHFCYLDENLWGKFLDNLPCSDHSMLAVEKLIKEWVKEEFDITIVYAEDVYKVKESIKKVYKEKYPEIYLEGDSDRQGWSRVWLNQHLIKYLEE